ncbi:MAG: hypothetical protein JSU04_11840 [Bdellovibrionales bacterium]|nr:hypothetical protein [Bdellovibrionales bacterium]
MKNLKLFVIAFLTTAHAFAADNVKTDPVGDIDNSITACPDVGTDMVETSFSREGENFVATMKMSKNIDNTFGYKEYYFWIDVNQTDKKGHPVGYQPYDPESVAWPNMYADYRIFLSLDANNESHRAYPSVRMQDCAASDCSKDGGLRYEDNIKVDIKGNEVIFTWPKSLVPAIESAASLKVGYTTYYEIGGACHGEDDSPQWGRNAYVIAKPKSPAPAPAPKPQ